jgi:hypothetical protein
MRAYSYAVRDWKLAGTLFSGTALNISAFTVVRYLEFHVGTSGCFYRCAPDARISCDLRALPFNSLGFYSALRTAAATRVLMSLEFLVKLTSPLSGELFSRGRNHLALIAVRVF